MRLLPSSTGDLACDVVVIGGGHAGTEAAAAAARLGARTVLVTHSAATVGAMSCNPAIGGIGKGHLVREIDALDGVMGRAADAAGIQFRLLNRRKGPAVRGPRSQADRKLYARAVQALLSAYDTLSVLEGEAAGFDIVEGRIAALRLGDGRRVRLGALVVATGTFLSGTIHIGQRRVRAGRFGEAASDSLAAAFAPLGLARGRLKTGTPPRLDGRTIRWSAVGRQGADPQPSLFSFLPGGSVRPQIECGVTRTTPDTHRLIRESLHLSPMVRGDISGPGPRYCPSIEDKVTRFADRDGHQLFLEPEGLDDTTVYPNGISTSLPEEVQRAVIASIPGLESAAILRPGYAIEYDYFDPRGLTESLASHACPNLFLAGQVNGTTGYEEAAAQGLVAGFNAALLCGAAAPFRLSRAQGYVGVLIDDLITRGVTEPYRMFTSRSEFRLSLRADNADERLTPLADAVGGVSAERRTAFAAQQAALSSWRERLRTLSLTPHRARQHGIELNQDGVVRDAAELLTFPSVTMEALCRVWPELGAMPAAIAERLSTDAAYAAYLPRQAEQASALLRDETVLLGADLDYAGLQGLSTELKARLGRIRPQSLGQASRVEGITPAALTLLAGHAARARRGLEA